jgi:hypothetical protein
MSERLLVLVMLLPVALLLVALALPLVRGAVKPNWIYGFRLPSTVNDPNLWYPANAYAGRWLAGIGAAMALAVVTLYFVPSIDDETYAVSIVIGVAAAVALSVAMSMRKLAQLKREQAGRRG